MSSFKENAFIQSKREAVLEIQAQIAQHRDLAIKGTTSLTPGGKDFDADAWVKKRNELECSLIVAKIEYALAMKVDSEEFPTKDNEGTEINLDEIDLNK